jgi:hypothetical protein
MIESVIHEIQRRVRIAGTCPDVTGLCRFEKSVMMLSILDGPQK